MEEVIVRPQVVDLKRSWRITGSTESLPEKVSKNEENGEAAATTESRRPEVPGGPRGSDDHPDTPRHQFAMTFKEDKISLKQGRTKLVSI